MRQTTTRKQQLRSSPISSVFNLDETRKDRRRRGKGNNNINESMIGENKADSKSVHQQPGRERGRDRTGTGTGNDANFSLD